MPEKAALQTPLKPALWYARPVAPHFSETFRLGPFPSLEDALVEVREELPLPAGTVVEFGQLTPWVPDAGAKCILDSLGLEACGPENGSVGSAWCNTLESIMRRDDGAAVAELNEALNLVLWGWMTKHECHPNFGTIGNVLIYRVNEGKALEPAAPAPPPAPEPEPPEKWDRCTRTGQNLSTMRQTRCCLRAGHGGPCQMEELKVPEVRFANGLCRCTFIRPTDGKRCNRMELAPQEKHAGEHAFWCGKLVDDEPGSSCDLEEGHTGPCRETPF